MKETYQTSRWLFGSIKTGNGSSRETEEFLIHPNEIKNLDTGSCVYFAKKPTRLEMIKVRFLDFEDDFKSNIKFTNKIKMSKYDGYKEVDPNLDMVNSRSKKSLSNHGFKSKLKTTINQFEVD